ncbi:MAG: hypothetical protein Q9196_001667 [Gyalolechia fulgens]
MSAGLMMQDAAASTLLAYAFTGGLGEPEGRGVSYALIGATPSTFTWSAALEEFDGPPKPIHRYRVEIDRRSKEVLPPQPIMLPDSELAEVILAATGQRVASSTRFTDGALSISYKVTVHDDSDIAYVVQLRHHGRVASMDFLMAWLSKNIDPRVLPVPPVYPILGELQRQEATAARASSDRLGGPFSSVREYLRAHIRSSFVALENQQGIDEYKGRFQDRINGFIDKHLDVFPLVIKEIPVVTMHTDMGLHNIILSSQTPTEIRAIIDWEFVASTPYPSLHPIIERLFRKRAANLFSPEFDRADELRDAFWDAIPDWKRWNQSAATEKFLQWFRFGLFMKPEPLLDHGILDSAKQAFWRENIHVVENMLSQYSAIPQLDRCPSQNQRPYQPA